MAAAEDISPALDRKERATRMTSSVKGMPSNLAIIKPSSAANECGFFPSNS